MADEEFDREKEYCVGAFKEGNKLMAEQLLSRIPQPAAVTTTFKFTALPRVLLKMVSLLHLAAYWGWEDVVTELVSVHGCSIECKDGKKHIPLHYAAYSGHLELTKYFAKGLRGLLLIEVLRMGYISDIFRIFPSGQQPCSRAAMYSGDWGKSLFTSLISYAGS